MFKNIFKKKEKENSNDKDVIVASLLVHAAKMDQNYTDKEKKLSQEQ